jgi:hypothetical protein
LDWCQRHPKIGQLNAQTLSRPISQTRLARSGKENALNTNSLPESELLLPFEIRTLPSEYKAYYLVKRQNFFASIQDSPESFSCYMLLDKIWLREFEDMKASNDPERMFPLVLYLNAHAKTRIGTELALSGCLAEARSIFRDAIEFVAHAHHMLGDPTLREKWLDKNNNVEAFKDAFERNKKTGLFNGLAELHRLWRILSETGSHANITAICERFVSVDDGENVGWGLGYFGTDGRMWMQQIFWMLAGGAPLT